MVKDKSRSSDEEYSGEKPSIVDKFIKYATGGFKVKPTKKKAKPVRPRNMTKKEQLDRVFDYQEKK